MGYGTRLHLVYGITDEEEDLLGNIHILRNDPLYYNSEGEAVEVDGEEWDYIQDCIVPLDVKNARNPNFYIGFEIANFLMLAGSIPLEKLNKHKEEFELNSEAKNAVDLKISKLPDWFKKMFQDATPKLLLVWSED